MFYTFMNECYKNTQFGRLRKTTSYDRRHRVLHIAVDVVLNDHITTNLVFRKEDVDGAFSLHTHLEVKTFTHSHFSGGRENCCFEGLVILGEEESK